ncbi:MAG: hypothetical protein K2Q06_11380 [Parvularculaceae bacterium]|nr:hypothetical protein [Parvularculaceae bacterium]
MITILEFLALLLVLLLIAQLIYGFGIFAPRRRGAIEPPQGAGAAPALDAAAALRGLADAQAALKSRYPAVFGMLSGYLNAHSIETAGSLESAVKQMIADWGGRRDQVKGELVRILAENESEEGARAVVLSACDATFEQEGYRNWLIWLLGRFNAM